MNTRVLYVSTFLSAGKNRSYCEDLAARLEARGARVMRTSTRLGRVQRLADMLYTTWAQRAAYEVAIVDVFSGLAFVWAEAVCFELRRLGKPYVLTLHGGLLPEFARQWPRRTRKLLGSAVLVTAPSAFMCERMHDYRDDIVVLRNAVDTHAYAFTPRIQPRPHLVWVRAFHAIYNPLLAIDVLAELAVGFRDITLSMIGPDKGDGSLRAAVARARDVGVTDRVRFVGGITRSEVCGHLARADVFLNTTDVDNTPLSILEAAAAGLCVISTSVGGIPFLLGHDLNALLVPPRDPAAMSSAVTRVLREPGLGERLSRAAHELAVEHDWTPVLDQWEHALERVTHG